MSKEEAETGNRGGRFQWTLSRSEPYLNPELYPNYETGGDLTDWKNNSNNALFPITTTSAVAVGDTVCLKLELDCTPYYSDLSVPHGSATLMMDYIGWYSLAAVQGEAILGSVAAKIVPYDHFRTMGEVYDEIEELATMILITTWKNLMGRSQCGYDMPY
jgi:hypothetical protein